LAGAAPKPAPGSEPVSQLRQRESRFKPLSLKEIADLPPPEWLIGGLVPQDGLVVLYGEPAAGKSFVALDWGLSVATGTPWLGHEVKQGEVVYIYAEGARGLTWRAEAWFQEHGKAEAPSFWAVPVAVPIPDPDERSEFVNAVRAVSKRPRLIIIDTLARNFGEGNESLTQDMNAFVNGCYDLRAAFPFATVLVVHHPGKDQKKGARGSIALKGAADAEFVLTRSGDEAKLTNEKQKDGEEARPISLELARVKLPDGNTSRVVRATNGGMVGVPAAERGKRTRALSRKMPARCKLWRSSGLGAPPCLNGNGQRLGRRTLSIRAVTGWWRRGKYGSMGRRPAMSWCRSRAAVQVQDWSRMDRTWSRSRK
jgi:hypothetical protein